MPGPAASTRPTHSRAPGQADDHLVYDYINSFLAPKSGMFEIDAYGFGRSNNKAGDLIGPERLQEPGLSDVADMMATAVFQPPTARPLGRDQARNPNFLPGGRRAHSPGRLS